MEAKKAEKKASWMLFKKGEKSLSSTVLMWSRVGA